MNKELKISDLCDGLNPQYYEELDVKHMTDLKPSKQRIEDMVLQKLHQEEPTAPAEKGGHGKKKGYKVLLIAAICCLFTTTAFAMTGGFEYFRSIFGDTVENAEHTILSPGITVTDGSRQMTLESMLTDGYQINLIVSLKALSGKPDLEAGEKEAIDLFQTELKAPASHPSDEENTIAYTCYELTEFASVDQRYYHIQLASLVDCTDWKLKLSLAEEIGSLSLEAGIEGTTAAVEVAVNQTIDNSLTIESIQLSQLGVLIIGSEHEAKGGLPTPLIDLIWKDGTREELISPMSFDSGDGEFITGGGGVIIGEDPVTGPLMTGTYGQRNPSGKLAIAGEFGRIIQMEQVEAISVNGSIYPIN